MVDVQLVVFPVVVQVVLVVWPHVDTAISNAVTGRIRFNFMASFHSLPVYRQIEDHTPEQRCYPPSEEAKRHVVVLLPRSQGKTRGKTRGQTK